MALLLTTLQDECHDAARVANIQVPEPLGRGDQSSQLNNGKKMITALTSFVRSLKEAHIAAAAPAAAAAAAALIALAPDSATT